MDVPARILLALVVTIVRMCYSTQLSLNERKKQLGSCPFPDHSERNRVFYSLSVVFLLALL